jgi:hypothetical protein
MRRERYKIPAAERHIMAIVEFETFMVRGYDRPAMSVRHMQSLDISYFNLIRIS